jgi:hypothetical protein
MPIPNLTDENPINQYVASSAQTEFAFTFYIFAESDIKVYVNDILKTITTDYAARKNDGGVIGSADLPMDGGKIVFNVGLTAGDKVSINREVPIDRSTQFSNGGSFKADVLNSELTRILTVAQQLKRDVSRSFRLAPSDAEGGSLQLPTNRANNILAFDGSGNLTLIKLADIDKANVSPFIATLLNDADAAEARTTLNAQPLAANLSNFANLTPSANKILIIDGSGAMVFQDRLATTTNQGVSYLNNPISVANNVGSPNDTIDFGPGTFITSSGQQIYLPAITKKIQSSGAWIAGTGQNGLDSGVRTASTFYRSYVIQNNTTLAYDILFSASATSPTVPIGYTNLGIINYAFIRVNASTNIAVAKWDVNIKQLVLGAGESITAVSMLVAGSGNTAILNTTEPLEFTVRTYLQTSVPGGSDFAVYGSEQSASDPHDCITVATNNAHQATGGGSVYTSDGRIYWKNFSVLGGVINQICKIKAIKIRR